MTGGCLAARGPKGPRPFSSIADGNTDEKGAARGCKRPKSREETPKEGGGKATQIALPRCSNMPPRRTKRKARFRRAFDCCVAMPNGHTGRTDLRTGPRITYRQLLLRVFVA